MHCLRAAEDACGQPLGVCARMVCVYLHGVHVHVHVLHVVAWHTAGYSA
jgi:hypothetical protein